MLENVVPIDAVHFFAFQIDCHYAKGKKLEKKHQLPSLASFHGSRPFADVSLGWHERGICVQVSVNGAFNEPDFPKFTTADSIELFFDTRDVKTTGYNTRFCHHFYFLPDPVQQNGDRIQAGEVTRFRTDDVHELCDASQLLVRSTTDKKKRIIKIFIPSESLHGYDPRQFDRLGFTYRLNRINGSKQYYSASDEDFTIESQPSLWASLRLLQEKR